MGALVCATRTRQKYENSHLRNESTRVDQLEPHFWAKEQKCQIGYITRNKALESLFPKLYTISKSVEPLARNSDPNMTQNEHVYVICCRPDVADDVISGGNVKSTENYVVLNFEAARFSSL